jgi:hypothetical protein
MTCHGAMTALHSESACGVLYSKGLPLVMVIVCPWVVVSVLCPVGERFP